MGDQVYSARKSTPRNLTAKQLRTLWDLFSYTPGLWNDGLALAFDAKDFTGFYPTYEAIFSTVKRFPEYQLLGSDVSQAILKNTLNNAIQNHIKFLKGETDMTYEMPHWRNRSNPLPLMTTVRPSYIDREFRIFKFPMSQKMAGILRAEAKERYEQASKVIKCRKKCKTDKEYLDKAIKQWKKDNPKEKIRTSRLRKRLERELVEYEVITSVKKSAYVKNYIEERKVTFDIPENVDIDRLRQVIVTQHKHGSYIQVQWMMLEDKDVLPKTTDELPQAQHPTPSLAKAMTEASEKRATIPNCKRVDATIDLNVKNLIACSLLAIKDEKQGDGEIVEVATPFYSFVIDGGWLLSSYRLTEKSLGKINAELDSWKNLRGEKSWTKKKNEIVKRTEGEKNPSRRRRQRHLNAIKNKRTEQYAKGKIRSDTIIDIVVKGLFAILGSADVSRICVGHTKGQKNAPVLKHGGTPSQNFQKINYTRIRGCILHWSRVFGWVYEESEESYTSKVSSYDQEELPIWDGSHHPEYKFVGKRIHRGLFRTADNTLINADINGALNIWRKCSPKGRLDRAEGLAGVYHPRRVTVEALRS